MTRPMLMRVLAVVMLCELISGCRAKPPLVLKESFADKYAQRSTQGKPCPVLVERVTDARNDAKFLGLAAGRSVHAPADIDAWLRNVLAGLSTRGVDVSFDASRLSDPRPLMASFTLKIAWISSIYSNRHVTVSWQMQLRRGDVPLADRVFRGMEDVADPSNSDVELQHVLDRAFGQSLDLMAAELLAKCGPNS